MLELGIDASGQIGIDLLRVPPDDSGATTPANYHYQTEIIASFCACMPGDADLREVICEWDEDFILVRPGSANPLELVSVKHRERDDYTTLGLLCTEGGLAHLFDRWLGYTTAPRARLCSNAKLSGRPSEPTPRALEALCASQQVATQPATQLICHLAWALMDVVKDIDPDDEKFQNIPRPTKPLPKKAGRGDGAQLPQGLFDALLRFVLVLRFDCGRPDKRHISDTNIRQLVEPAMVAHGHLSNGAVHAYAEIVDLISEASRDRSGKPRDLARYLADPNADTADAKILATLERRTITRQHVLSAMRAGAARTSNAVPLFRSGQLPPRAAGGHHLREKMTLGGIDNDEQQNALDLRDLWLHTWPQVSTGFPEDVEHKHRLQLEILDVVREVRRQLIGVADPFGFQFNAELNKALRAAQLGKISSVPLDDFHIIGFAYELSDICKFGFVRPGGAQ